MPDMYDDTKTGLSSLEIAGHGMNALFERIMVMIPSIVVVFDIKRNAIIWSNQLARNFFNADLARMAQGGPDIVRQRIHPDDWEALLDHSATVRKLADDETSRYEFRARNNDNEWRWFAGEDRICARGEDGSARLIVTSALDVTEQRLREEHQRHIAMELDHRVKNTLAIIQSIASQTAKTSDARDFGRELMRRVRGLIASQDALQADDAPNVELADLITYQLRAFDDHLTPRVFISGPKARLKDNVFQSLGMAFHELIRNAYSHGALSTESGTINIQWNFKEGGDGRKLCVTWNERGGPQHTDASVPGFGRTVLTKIVSTMTNGNTDYRIRPDGVTWQLEAPVENTLR